LGWVSELTPETLAEAFAAGFDVAEFRGAKP